MKNKVFAIVGFTGVSALASLIVISIFSSVSMLNLFADDIKIGASKPPVVLNDQVKILNKAYTDASQAVLPTVVSISVVFEQKVQNNDVQKQFEEFFRFFGNPQDRDNPNDKEDQTYRSEGAGSGVVISADGYIVTNNHVVEDAKEIKVKTYDQKEFEAKLIGRDPNTDLAVIKIEASDLPVAYLGDINDVQIGEIVIAVGNPLGLNSTVTSGIVSAIGRGGLNIAGAAKGGFNVENFIQTDAAINPGNSGGGLFNLDGSLIGINSAIATRTGTYMGYGFAIPIDLVKSVVKDLIDDGKIDRGYIGVNIKSIDELEAKSAGLDKVAGAMVHNVKPGSAGEKAGLEVGDIIVEFNGKPVKSSNELQGMIVLHRAGDEINLGVWRDGKKIYKKVTLQRLDDSDDMAEAVKGEPEDNGSKKPVSFDKLGFSVAPITTEAKKNLEVKSGALVTKVDRYSKAAERGIVPNGVIVKADKKPVNSPEDLKKILESKKPGDAVLLQIKYKDTNRIVAVEIPNKE